MSLVPVLVSGVSLVIAAAATAIAWKILRAERRRAAARVAVLAAAIHETSEREPLMSPPPSRGPLAVAIAIAVLLLAAVTSLVLMAEGGSRISGRARDAVRPAAGMPLELSALEHDHDDGRLIVRGIVRNPAAGAALDDVTAVVMALSRDGRFVTSGASKVAGRTLSPGAETAFVVEVPGAGKVDRYRVSFRSGDRIVPHVDRRDRGAPRE